MTTRQRHLLPRVFFAVCVAGTTCAVAYVADRLLGLGLYGRFLAGREKLVRPSDQIVCYSDSRLGWRLIPDAKATYHKQDYTATYTIDHDGNRMTPSVPASGPLVILLGCSYTFGEGVNDNETFGAVLQNEYWRRYRIRNLACMAYSTTHAMLRLEDELRRGEKVHLVIYGWIFHHRMRNYRRRSWLSMFGANGPRNPFFELEHGRLVQHDPISPNEGIPDEDPSLAKREWSVTIELIKSLYNTCERNHIAFLCLMLPWALTSQTQDTDEPLRSLFRSSPINCLDLSHSPELLNKDLYFLDCHPKATWHRKVARIISEDIDPQTGGFRPTSTSPSR